MDRDELEKEFNELKSKITPSNTVKYIVGTLASLGATAAVIALMRNPLQTSKGLTKLLMKLGIFVLACKAGDVADKYLKETVDEAEKTFREGMKEMKEAQANG